MPNVTVNVGKQVSYEQKLALQQAIGENMSILPTKTIDNTTITIRDGLDMFRSGGKIEGAFMDVRLFGKSPEEAKAAFCVKMGEILLSQIAIDPKLVHINFTEFEHWGSGSGYR